MSSSDDGLPAALATSAAGESTIVGLSGQHGLEYPCEPWILCGIRNVDPAELPGKVFLFRGERVLYKEQISAGIVQYAIENDQRDVVAFKWIKGWLGSYSMLSWRSRELKLRRGGYLTVFDHIHDKYQERYCGYFDNTSLRLQQRIARRCVEADEKLGRWRSERGFTRGLLGGAGGDEDQPPPPSGPVVRSVEVVDPPLNLNLEIRPSTSAAESAVASMEISSGEEAGPVGPHRIPKRKRARGRPRLDGSGPFQETPIEIARRVISDATERAEIMDPETGVVEREPSPRYVVSSDSEDVLSPAHEQTPYQFFTADQRRKVDHELMVLKRGSAAEVAYSTREWLKGIEDARKATKNMKGSLSGKVKINNYLLSEAISVLMTKYRNRRGGDAAEEEALETSNRALRQEVLELKRQLDVARSAASYLRSRPGTPALGEISSREARGTATGVDPGPGATEVQSRVRTRDAAGRPDASGGVSSQLESTLYPMQRALAQISGSLRAIESRLSKLEGSGGGRNTSSGYGGEAVPRGSGIPVLRPRWRPGRGIDGVLMDSLPSATDDEVARLTAGTGDEGVDLPPVGGNELSSPWVRVAGRRKKKRVEERSGGGVPPPKVTTSTKVSRKVGGDGRGAGAGAKAASRASGPPPPGPRGSSLNKKEYPPLPPPPTGSLAGARRGEKGRKKDTEERRKATGGDANSRPPPPPPKKKKKKPSEARRRRRGLRKAAAVAITVIVDEEISYTTVMRRAKEVIDLKSLGIDETGVRRAATGALLIEIPGVDSGPKAERLADQLSHLFLEENRVKIARPMQKVEIRVSGFDDSVTAEDIVRAIGDAGGCLTRDIRLGPINYARDGLGSVLASCPAVAGLRVAEDARLRVGWAAPRVVLLKARPLKCYRCLAIGHMQQHCPAKTSRAGCCFNCGEEGHRREDCRRSPHCPVCAGRGRKASHRPGGVGCEPVPPVRRSRFGAGPEKTARSAARPRSPVVEEDVPHMDTSCGPEGGDAVEIIDVEASSGQGSPAGDGTQRESPPEKRLRVGGSPKAGPSSAVSPPLPKREERRKSARLGAGGDGK